MCGLAGYHTLSRSDIPFDKELLNRLHASIAHRGPDGHGIWTSDNRQLALVHRRLKIIDVSNAGAQPMMDAHKSVVIVFNGEIYNYLELRALLQQDGYIFSSQTDTEVILYAYKKWGIACLDYLDGMFAFALFDIHTNELYLVRDRIGIKPLYFSLQSQVLSFASEIKALWELPWIEKQIKHEALSYYLSYLATPAPMTLYEGIYKLPAGFYLKCDAQRTVTFHQWYDQTQTRIIAADTPVHDETYYIDHIRTLFDNAVKKRMRADVPVGIFLSGGIDSSLNLAHMARYTQQLKTFNVSFDDGPELQERAWARMVAHKFGAEHHELIISEKEAFDSFQKIIFHQDEPLGDPVCIPLYHVSHYAKKAGVTVVQIGEGSDELFCGYPMYADYINLNRYWQPSQRFIPATVRHGLSYAASWYPCQPNKKDLLSRWAHGQPLFCTGALVFSATWKQKIMHPMSMQQLHDPIIEQIYANFPQGTDCYAMIEYHRARLRTYDPHADFVKTIGYVELKHRLAELLLMRVDKMTMAAGIEARVPFLDYKLVEFALQIPASLKYKDDITKYILKKACEGIIPDEVIYRKKVGFNAPTTRWFKSGHYFKEQLQDLLHSPTNEISCMLNVPAINAMLRENSSQTNVDYAPQLWALQNVLAHE